MKKKFTHIHSSGNPQMVDVSGKAITTRVAEASGEIILGEEIIRLMEGDELITKKGPVFQTARIAGVMAAKRTSELIPFCHPLSLEDCQVLIQMKGDVAVIKASCKTSGKTGVEMEALTAATVAALTIYDMCKAISHDMIIGQIKLLRKTGGKKDFTRKTTKSAR
jgi:cyclic pyranopterin monophosphate synthase